MENKFVHKEYPDGDDYYDEITNGPISLCTNDGPEQETIDAIVNALNADGHRWYSNNELELKQHIEIMGLKYELEDLKAQQGGIARETIEDILFKSGKLYQEECTYLADIILQDCPSAYQQLKDENDSLRRWKIEAAELLTKIHAYAHKHLEIKLGQSVVDFVIKHAKERDELKEKGDKMAEMIDEARLQIEYLHKRWQQTGSGNNVLSRIETALNAWNGNPKKEGEDE